MRKKDYRELCDFVKLYEIEAQETTVPKEKLRIVTNYAEKYFIDSVTAAYLIGASEAINDMGRAVTSKCYRMAEDTRKARVKRLRNELKQLGGDI